MQRLDVRRMSKGLPYRWGALPEELQLDFPCDATATRFDAELFRAVTVNAPPRRVYPWLCQLRIAPYSYDWVDNSGRPSPPFLSPHLPNLIVGQRFMRIFELLDFEKDRQITLALRNRRAQTFLGKVWVTYLVVPHLDNASRLIVKLRARDPELPFASRTFGWLLAWGDLIMMRKQLLTLKSLAERALDATETR